MKGAFHQGDGFDRTDAKDQLIFQLEMQRTKHEWELAALRQNFEDFKSSAEHFSRCYLLGPVARITLDHKSSIREANELAARMMGVQREQVIGMPFTGFVARRSISDLIGHLHRCRISTGDRIESELILKGRNQKETPLRIVSVRLPLDGKVLYETALINIRAQKTAEQSLQEAKMSARAIVQMVDHPLLMLDAELCVLSANPAFYRRYKTKKSEIVGRSLVRFVSSTQQAAELQTRLLDVIVRKKGFQKFQVESKNGAGATRILLLSAQPFLHQSKDGGFILLSVTELTQSVAAEQEREDMLQKLVDMGHQLETRVEERTNELQTTNWKLQTLTARLLEAQEMERRHLARELHDEIGQQITCLQILTDKQIALAPASLRSALQETQHASSELLETVRELSSDLRPQLLDDFGLIAALAWHFKRFHKRTGIKVRLDKKDFHEDLLNSFLRNVLFRATQEALTNVARHAATNAAHVTLSTRKGFCTLQVSDKGKGFDVEVTLAKGSFGLTGLQERTFLAGGTLTFDSAPGKGTTVTIDLPLMLPHTDPLERELRPEPS
jgi:PAS domain S-box-containing protein